MTSLLRLRRVAPRVRASCTSGNKGEISREKPAKIEYRPFEVNVVNPPPRSLGFHKLPKNTHCGECVEVENNQYFVKSVTTRYRLVCGKYEKDSRAVSVTSASRYVIDRYLESLL